MAEGMSGYNFDALKDYLQEKLPHRHVTRDFKSLESWQNYHAKKSQEWLKKGIISLVIEGGKALNKPIRSKSSREKIGLIVTGQQRFKKDTPGSVIEDAELKFRAEIAQAIEVATDLPEGFSSFYVRRFHLSQQSQAEYGAIVMECEIE